MNRMHKFWSRISADKKSNIDMHGERSTLLEKVGCCKTYIGISYPNSEEFIEFHFDSLDSNLIAEDIVLNGLSFKQRFEQNVSGLSFVLKRKQNESSEVFALIAEDIYESLLKKQHFIDKDAYFLILQRIRLWISFLDNPNCNLLSLRDQVGLYGELTVLLKTYDTYENCKVWLNSWRGPDKEAKDFINSSYELELKTTLGAKDYVHISNEYQLEADSKKPLYLKTLVIEEDNRGQNLPELVDSIFSRIGSDERCLDSFLIKLNLASYSHLDKAAYTAKFALTTEHTYRVETEFPCITSKEIPLGVEGIKYKINVNKINKFLIDNNRLFMEH